MVTINSSWLNMLRAMGICALLLMYGPCLQAAGDDAIAGTWLTENRDSKVAIERTGNTFSGKIVWLQTPEPDGKPLVDAKNANAALRMRPIMGLEILSQFAPSAGGLWTGGTIYSPRNGRSYPAQLSIAPDGRLDIRVKDGVFSKHLYWTR